MNSFNTTVNGIDCLCRVIRYQPYIPPRTVVQIDDSEEEVPSEFGFEITDSRGTRLPHLTGFALEDEATFNRLQDEYEAFVTAAKHGKDF